MKLLDLQIIRVNAGYTHEEAKQLIHQIYNYGYSWGYNNSDRNTTHWNTHNRDKYEEIYILGGKYGIN